MVLIAFILSYIAFPLFLSWYLRKKSKWKINLGYVILVLFCLLNPFLFILLEIKTTQIKGCLTYVVGYIAIGFFLAILPPFLYYMGIKKIPENGFSSSGNSF